MARVTVTVSSDAHAPSLVLSVVPAFAAAVAVSEEDERRLHAAVERLLAFMLENAYPDHELGEVEVTLELGEDCVQVSVHDWGLPLTSAGGDAGPLPERLAELAADAANVRLLNLGADGKRLTADVPVRMAQEAARPRHELEVAPRRAPAGAEEAIEVRVATADDAEAIAQLLYENYHLSYVHADFYRPRYLMSAFDSGELRSTIAVHEGRVIGHHALMPLQGAPSAETGAAVVHSAYRGLGIFGRLFSHTLDAARELELGSVFGDAVTVHPFSQRAEVAHGYRETALQLAMVPAQTTMRGFGADGPKLRTATLRSYLTFDESPRQVSIPRAYGELLESVYANVGVAVEAAEGIPAAGDAVTTRSDEARALGFLRVRRWDGAAGTELTHAVRHLLSLHVDVIYADVDLAALDAVDDAISALNELGFSAAGLVLHGPDANDHLRLQRLDSEEVELDKIVCDSAFAERLKSHVLQDLARVGR